MRAASAASSSVLLTYEIILLVLKSAANKSTQGEKHTKVVSVLMGHMQHSHFSGILALLGARTHAPFEVAVDDAYLGSKLGARDGVGEPDVGATAHPHRGR